MVAKYSLVDACSTGEKPWQNRPTVAQPNERAADRRKMEGKKGSLIMILHEIQGNYGYIPRHVAMDLSGVIDVPARTDL